MLIKWVVFLLFLNGVATSHAWRQEDLQQRLFQIKSERLDKKQKEAIFLQIPSHSIPLLKALDFNIKELSSISKLEPKTRPGIAPDWGTDLFESMIFKDFKFEECNFKYLNFSKAHFENVVFVRCNFEGTLFDEATFKDVIFEECILSDSHFQKSILNQILFDKNKFCYANFMEAELNGVSFIDNDLEGSNFLSSRVSSSVIKGDLENVLLFETAQQFNVAAPAIRKPIVLLSWDNKNPGVAVAKILGKIKELDAIPLKFNFKDSDIDEWALKHELYFLLQKMKESPNSDKTKSFVKRILDLAKQLNLPEIAKIQKKAKLYVDSADGILLPGGQDIHPLFYEQTPHLKTILTTDFRRDLFEFAIMQEADIKETPLLGICRGMQLSNIWYGGSLNQHIEGHRYVIQDYFLTNSVKNESIKSRIKEIFNRNQQLPFKGYAFHHQAVDVIGNGLTVSVTSSDGTVKALEKIGNRFVLLIQWHPEYKGDTSTPESASLEAKLSAGNHDIYIKFIESVQKL
jgi:gamma-glutamyl-gamma-aminobutyrate hydrolase PuuD